MIAMTLREGVNSVEHSPKSLSLNIFKRFEKYIYLMKYWPGKLKLRNKHTITVVEILLCKEVYMRLKQYPIHSSIYNVIKAMDDSSLFPGPLNKSSFLYPLSWYFLSPFVFIIKLECFGALCRKVWLLLGAFGLFLRFFGPGERPWVPSARYFDSPAWLHAFWYPTSHCRPKSGQIG